MGQYNFDQILDRTHTKSLKYDFAVKRGKPADVLPFWVADMDFEIPPELKQILLDRVNHGVFGYTESDDEYFDVLKNWFTTRFNWTPEQKWLVKTPGIVFALAMAVRAFTKEGKVCSSTNQCTTHLAWLLMTTIGVLSMCHSSKATKNTLSILKASSAQSLRKMLHYSSCVIRIIQ